MNNEENTLIENSESTEESIEETVEEKMEENIEGSVEFPEEDAEEVIVKRAENPEAVIEAVLFAMGNSVEYSKLSEVLGMSIEETKTEVSKFTEKLNRNKNRGVTITELDGSVQMCSKTNMYEYLIKVASVPKKYSLTDSVLETLSIVAYKQPVTRLEIEKIRGVDCSHSVNRLVEYGLISEIGRLDAPGRPLLFGTTEEFLRSFGVKSLEELPVVTADRLEEFKKEAALEMQVELDV